MNKHQEKIRHFVEISYEIKKIINSSLDWEMKYDLIFCDEISEEIFNSSIELDYDDPDASYEEDVMAFANSVIKKANILRQLIEEEK